MSFTRGQVKDQILSLLTKNVGASGFYTDAKINYVIQECLDFIAVEMFIGGNGWLNELAYIDTVAGVFQYSLPASVAMIQELRYLIGNRYLPVIYDDANIAAQIDTSTGVTQFPSRYRIVGNQIYFNPPPAAVGPAYIQIEYNRYPATLATDGDTVEPQFDNCLIHYVVYRSASILASQAGKPIKEWEKFEDQWYGQMLKVVNKRIKNPVQIKEFTY